MLTLRWLRLPPRETSLEQLLVALNRFVPELLRRLGVETRDRASFVGVPEAGAGALLAEAPIPADALAARVTALGDIYNGVGTAHEGHLVALWQADSNRIRVLHDVDHTAGVDQGFAVTVEAGALVVRNKATATAPQSADVFVEWLR